MSPEELNTDSTDVVFIKGTEGRGPKAGKAGVGLTCHPWGIDGSRFRDFSRVAPSAEGLEKDPPFLDDMFRARLWSPACTVNPADPGCANAQFVTVPSEVFAPE